ncbi:MAG TPA: 50S ribosomal protein L25/general stress protein Ctc [Rhizomicrobium sp.]
MRQVQDLKAEARQGTGKGPSYQTRQKGLVPGVLYGGKGQPENVAVERHTLERQVETGNFLTTLYMLDIEGKKQRVIPRAVQVDPISDRPVHVDFMRLEEGAKVKLEIPVRFKNHESSPGLKKGGVLNIIRHEVLMLCPADNIPDSIEADLSGLDIHGTVHISSIKLPEGVKPLIRERDFTIASIVAPTSVIEEQRAAAAAAAAAASGAAPAEAAPAEGAAPAAGAAAPAAGAAPAADAKAAPKK